MKTLIIVPCYNESETILTLYREICEKTTCDVIVINDCSTDSSKDIMTLNNIPHIDLPLNLGIGGAVQTGYRYALQNGYDIAIQVDGDGQHDPSWIDNLIEPIIKGDADMVIGSRFIDNKGFQSSVMRRFGIRFFKTLIFCLSGKRITDATSGFRAINRKGMILFDNYYAKDYPEPESNMLALKNKLIVKEIPVTMRERQGGVSSISPSKSVYYMFKVSIGIIITSLREYPPLNN
ncbi:MAG: glycosyltransferase family 2 protein [Oscillospiraceae bacterium]|jgi:glycosyltransferase involved in cell wall biosynthesis|nr:glycosyltransferase family 2 protein [Oscillospiraceae bacterium]